MNGWPSVTTEWQTIREVLFRVSWSKRAKVLARLDQLVQAGVVETREVEVDGFGVVVQQFRLKSEAKVRSTKSHLSFKEQIDGAL